DTWYAPFFSGTLVPAFDLYVPLQTDASGTVRLESEWPADLPQGMPLYLQYWISGGSSWLASNALQATAQGVHGRGDPVHDWSPDRLAHLRVQLEDDAPSRRRGARSLREELRRQIRVRAPPRRAATRDLARLDGERQLLAAATHADEHLLRLG